MYSHKNSKNTDYIRKISPFNLSSCVVISFPFLGKNITYQVGIDPLRFLIFHILTFKCSYRNHICMFAKMGPCCLHYSVTFSFSIYLENFPYYVSGSTLKYMTA